MSAQLPTIGLDAVVYWLGGPRLRPDDLVTTEDGNRWNERGDAVVYLAGDLGVGLVEVGRHLQDGDADELEKTAWAIRWHWEGLHDLRSQDAWDALDLREPYWFLDRARCQRLSSQLRRSGSRGILVPSAGFADDAQRWNLVSFETDAHSMRSLVERARPVGRLMVRTLKAAQPAWSSRTSTRSMSSVDPARTPMR